MDNHSCNNCSFRAKYDNNQKSLPGRVWRWHASWCPGWKSYMKSLPEKDRISIAEKYSMDKYK